MSLSHNRFCLIKLQSHACVCEPCGTSDDVFARVCVRLFIPSAFRDGNLITNGCQGSHKPNPNPPLFEIMRMELTWMSASPHSQESRRKGRRQQQEVKVLQPCLKSGYDNDHGNRMQPCSLSLFPAAEHSPGRHGYFSFLPRSLSKHRL